jgi:hypothetical protein
MPLSFLMKTPFYGGRMHTYFEHFSSQTLMRKCHGTLWGRTAEGKTCSKLLSGQLLALIMAETRQDIY